MPISYKKSFEREVFVLLSWGNGRQDQEAEAEDIRDVLRAMSPEQLAVCMEGVPGAVWQIRARIAERQLDRTLEVIRFAQSSLINDTDTPAEVIDALAAGMAITSETVNRPVVAVTKNAFGTVNAQLLEAISAIARKEQRHVECVLADALAVYLQRRYPDQCDPDDMSKMPWEKD